MSITATNLNAAKFFVGSDLTRLRGAADDFFKITKASDVGGMVGGIQGDVALFSRSQNGYIGELTLQQSSAAVSTLLQLSVVGETFPVKVEFNDYSFVGFAVIQNEGDLVASLGTMTRVITLAMAYVSGNVASGSGRTLQA
jgi:hypothetical protein